MGVVLGKPSFSPFKIGTHAMRFEYTFMTWRECVANNIRNSIIELKVEYGEFMLGPFTMADIETDQVYEWCSLSTVSGSFLLYRQKLYVAMDAPVELVQRLHAISAQRGVSTRINSVAND